MSLGLCVPAIAAGQQFRGAMVGTVTDPAGALVPGARVTLTGIATNTSLGTDTNGDGFYRHRVHPPGRYRLRVEASGFQPVTLEAIEIRVGDRLTLDQRLGIARLESTVMVRGDATPCCRPDRPPSGRSSIGGASRNPLADGNPFILARVAPGVAFTDVNNLRFTRAFDNGGTSSISANGVGSQASEFTLDGLPDNAAFGRQMAYVPPPKRSTSSRSSPRASTPSRAIPPGRTSTSSRAAVPTARPVRRTGSTVDEALAANEFFVNANPNCERDADGDCRKSPCATTAGARRSAAR